MVRKRLNDCYGNLDLQNKRKDYPAKPKTSGVNSVQKTKDTFLKQVYIPMELKSKLEEEADKEHRDINNLIVKILYDHYDNSGIALNLNKELLNNDK